MVHVPLRIITRMSSRATSALETAGLASKPTASAFVASEVKKALLASRIPP